MSAQLDAVLAAVTATQAKVDQLIALIPSAPPPDDTAALQSAADALAAADAKLDAAIAKLTPPAPAPEPTPLPA